MQYKVFFVFTLASVFALVSAAPVTIPLDAVPREVETNVEAREPSPEPFCAAFRGGCI
ncbi:hypothetical protein PM082_000146 [Marasmius tenuissimus]|nr:hypothetical protein PM082_000146 [Marasmius tenuissimus]